jgi:phage tail-like protein
MNRQEILRLLPEVFQRTYAENTPLDGLLLAMAALLSPIEDTLDHLDAAFDPHRTADEFVPMLAAWVDMDHLARGGDDREPSFPSGLGRLRELCAAAADLARVRGTRAGLLSFLETATGCPGFELLEGVTGPDRRPLPFHFVVRAPHESTSHARLLRSIVELEKPAHATFELEFAESPPEETP